MPTDEELIRKALRDRAATVTQSTLRYRELRQEPPTGRTPRPGSGGRPHLLFAIAATVVAIMAVAGGVYGLRSGSGHSRPARPADPLAGTQWRLSEVHSPHLTSRVPKVYVAGLAFGANGRLHGRDALLAAFTGRYHTSGNRITVRDLTPGIPLVNPLPSERALANILVPTAPDSRTVTSTFHLTATTLTIAGSRWTLTLRPLTAPASYCLDTPPPRPGTGTSLVPATPTAVTICPFGPNRTPKTVTDITALVQALDALPTRPLSKRCEFAGPRAISPLAVYELHFHYQHGADVLIYVLPRCPSERSVTNPLLQAAISPKTVLGLINAALDDG